MQRLVTVLFLLATAAAAADEAITCTGIWSQTASEEALVRKFGRANVERGMVYIAEGQETPGTILFPENEARRLEIVWRDAKRRRTPEWIRVPDGSRWIVPGGIRVGATLAAIEKINVKPFRLSGFDWDYGGMITDWRGGKLAKLSVPCRLQVRFDRAVPENPSGAQQRAIDETSGDRELLSSAASLRKLDVRVSQVIVQYD